jgi:hypothetical protein
VSCLSSNCSFRNRGCSHLDPNVTLHVGDRNTSLVLRIPSSYSNHHHHGVSRFTPISWWMSLLSFMWHYFHLSNYIDRADIAVESQPLIIYHSHSSASKSPGKCQERQQFPPMRSRLHRQPRPLVGKGGCGTPLMCPRKKDDSF